MKKLLLSAILLSLCKLSPAMEIDCYASGTRIYHGKGHNLLLDENSIAFIEDKSNKTVYINNTCVIKWSEHEFAEWLDEQIMLHTDYGNKYCGSTGN